MILVVSKKVSGRSSISHSTREIILLSFALDKGRLIAEVERQT